MSDTYLVSYSYEDRRMGSNSLYMPRSDDFEGSDDFSNCFEASSNAESNRATSPCPSPINESERISMKKDEVCEQSLPGSTEVDSEDNDFDSHFDAIEELSELFEAAPVNQENPRCIQLARPSNPIIKDNQFDIPRCSAPAPVHPVARRSHMGVSEMNFSSSFGSTKGEFQMSNYNKPSGSIMRPVARINYPSISYPANSF